VKRKSTAPSAGEVRRRVMLDDPEVADELGCKVHTLRTQRARRKPPLGTIPYYKFGRSVKYDPEDIRKFKASCRVEPEPRS
jgi:hypothetical protein